MSRRPSFVPALQALESRTLPAGLPAVASAAARSRGGEAVTAVSLPVVLPRPAAGAVTVRYAAAGGTATAGVDFTLAAGTLTFRPGQTRASIRLTVVNDNQHEPDE